MVWHSFPPPLAVQARASMSHSVDSFAQTQQVAIFVSPLKRLVGSGVEVGKLVCPMRQAEYAIGELTMMMVPWSCGTTGSISRWCSFLRTSHKDQMRSYLESRRGEMQEWRLRYSHRTGQCNPTWLTMPRDVCSDGDRSDVSVTSDRKQCSAIGLDMGAGAVADWRGHPGRRWRCCSGEHCKQLFRLLKNAANR